MKKFNYVSRISDNYHTSKDYSKLFDNLMSGKNNYVGFVARQYQDDSRYHQKIAMIFYQGLSIFIFSSGVGYFHFYKEDPNSKEQFISLCEKYDLEYGIPTKEGV